MDQRVPARPTRTTGRIVVGGRREGPSSDVTVIVHRSWRPGPTVVITANLHGDESVGLGVVRRLDRWLRETTEFCGTVVLYPSCNPEGLAAQTRRVPADDKDLNRQFPGSARGTWAARLAHALWRDISARRPELVIDLHADARASIPYVIVDRPVRLHGKARAALGERLLRLALATGFTVLREYEDDVYTQYALDRSLAGAVVNVLGVPAITLEVGPRRALVPEVVEVTLQATLGVLAEAGVVEVEGAVHPTRCVGGWRRSASPRVERQGVLEPLLAAGASLRPGQVMARLFNLAGELQEEIVAAESGIVVSWVDAPWIASGGVVATLGIVDEEPL